MIFKEKKIFKKNPLRSFKKKEDSLLVFFVKMRFYPHDIHKYIYKILAIFVATDL